MKWVCVVVALILSVGAILISWFRCPPMTFDSFGIYIGILSILVTALLGWQIYKAMEIDKKFNSLKADLKEYTDNTVKDSLELAKCDAIGSALSNIGMVFVWKQDYQNAFQICLNALSYLYEGSKCGERIDDINYTIERVIDIINWVESQKTIRLKMTETDLSIFLSSALKIEGHNGKRIVNFIHNYCITNHL